VPTVFANYALQFSDHIMNRLALQARGALVVAVYQVGVPFVLFFVLFRVFVCLFVFVVHKSHHEPPCALQAREALVVAVDQVGSINQVG
jgi:hypothetical protein